MTKTRQRPRGLPDGPVWVRTHPLTMLHDRIDPRHVHAWHQLTFATKGYLEVITDDARRLVPRDRAVWVPAGTPHVEVMRAPVSIRSIYVAPGATRHVDRLSATLRVAARPRDAGARDHLRTIAVSPLLRELILHISRLGALDRREPIQARLVGVLLDQLAIAPEVQLDLPLPRDARARRFADLVTAEPDLGMRELVRRAGASLRTIERCFLVETGVAVGEWRRRVRLFHALGLLEHGTSVTEAAYAIGYASLSAFTQAFARQFGRTPTGRTRG